MQTLYEVKPLYALAGNLVTESKFDFLKRNTFTFI